MLADRTGTEILGEVELNRSAETVMEHNLTQQLAQKACTLAANALSPAGHAMLQVINWLGSQKVGAPPAPAAALGGPPDWVQGP